MSASGPSGPLVYKWGQLTPFSKGKRGVHIMKFTCSFHDIPLELPTITSLPILLFVKQLSVEMTLFFLSNIASQVKAIEIQ